MNNTLYNKLLNADALLVNGYATTQFTIASREDIEDRDDAYIIDLTLFTNEGHIREVILDAEDIEKSTSDNTSISFSLAGDIITIKPMVIDQT